MIRNHKIQVLTKIDHSSSIAFQVLCVSQIQKSGSTNKDRAVNQAGEKELIHKVCLSF